MHVTKNVNDFLNSFIKRKNWKKDKEVLEVFYKRNFDEHPRMYTYFFNNLNTLENGTIYTCSFKVFKKMVSDTIGHPYGKIMFIEEK